MSEVKDFQLTTPLLGNQSYVSPVVDFLTFNTLSTASFYNTTDASQTTQQIVFQFSAERNQNFNFNEVVTMTLNDGVSKSFPIRARFGKFLITNSSSTPMSELRLSSLAFEEIQEVGINQVVDLEETLQAEDQRITDEIAARIAGDLTLQTQVFLKADQTDLGAEAVTRATADIALEQALALRATTQSVLDEQGARETADVVLLGNINAEATARALGDTNLQTSIDTERTARQLADTNLQTDVNTRATIVALASEVSARETADSTLQGNIDAVVIDRIIADNNLQANIDAENVSRVSADTSLENSINLLDTNLNLKASIQDLNTEIANRQSADNLKLNITDSIHSNLSFYALQSDNLTTVLSNITAQGSTLSLGSGSFGILNGDPLVINKQNISMYAPSSTPPLCELLMPITIPNTADRIRMRFFSFDGVATLNASRSVYNQCTFTENVNIGEGTTGYITLKDCEFVAGKTITVSNTFADVLYFVNCNFSGATLVLNQASPQQVIISNCGGLVSFPANAFYAGISALTTGYIQNSIAKTILPTTGSGTAGQVLTSGGANGIDTWTTPSGGGGGGGGTCLECIHLYPTGQSVTSVRGDTLTFQNVTQRQELTQSVADLTGSVVSYRPPTGTTKVIFSFYSSLSNRGNTTTINDAKFRMFFGSTQVTVARQYISLGIASATPYHEFSVVFNIGGTENIANAILGSWNSLVQLKWDGTALDQFLPFTIHNILGFDEETVFSAPKIKIEAYA
jgi:hypothetical protein